MDGATQYALAYALTTSAGLRGVLTLAAVSAATHLGWIHPPNAFAWLGSTSVTIALAAVAVVDFAADKVPVLDHVMHVVNVAIKPVCAAVIVAGTVHPHSQMELIALMTLGVFNALGIHAASASVRGTSTVTTAGIANPAISTIEDAGSLAMIVISFVTPFVGAALAIVIAITLFLFARQIWKTMRPARER